ncbi:hypothetical protein [Nocardia donostiensis]|uniref:Uncharacterized protein n=1 Tax=Nocardia donostiensis TaxID=1538463 RepID=A0A1V2TF43_9NOCA|nr:hypothetical protein [Nocardia donostiensis]ONM47981.1 hypothetical protein B0T46_15260 [Nocardia donostiensis]OQS13106.1 hypothetical protein B0T36_21360 [Nocardia donostiensis]OQS21524.1 hypothetical protein B0T44_07865 [Nocardia donostiensis]
MTIPAFDHADFADQNTFAHDEDRDIGLDTTAVTPLAEKVRAAFDTAETTDRIEQSHITLLPNDDDYPFAY